jgi:hypothetical protein
METPTRRTRLPTHVRLTTQVGQIHSTTESATEPRNQLPTSQTRERSETRKLESTDQHQLDHWAAPVRPIPASETWRLPQNGSTPVRPMQHTGQTDLSQKAPKHQTGLPSSKLIQTRNSSNTGQQRTHPNVHPSINPTRVSPVRPVRGTSQTGVTWASRDEQHPRVNTPKSKPQSPESLHGLEQDFGDIRKTSW